MMVGIQFMWKYILMINKRLQETDFFFFFKFSEEMLFFGATFGIKRV